MSLNLYHDLIQARQKEAATRAFNRQMQIRVGIESVISELVQAYGLRRARYRGQAKNALQVYFIGATTSLKPLAKASLLFVVFERIGVKAKHFPFSNIPVFQRVNLGCITPRLAPLWRGAFLPLTFII
ncbi:MAG: transposase [Anaerolineae bacterium]|nr:transposase [Anaerolineae bacterium]